MKMQQSLLSHQSIAGPLRPAILWDTKLPNMLSEATGRGTAEDPSPEMLKRGREFGEWFRDALHNAKENANSLAEKIKISRQLLYAYRNDCIGSDHRYRTPSASTIRLIASATGANVASGLRIMGYDPGDAPKPPQPLLGLHSEAQAALARFVQTLTPSDVVYLPVVGSVGAGQSILDAAANSTERAPMLRSMVEKYDVDDLFVVRVVGYCLAGAHIISGDMLICRYAEMGVPGQVVIVRDGDEVIAKRLHEDASGLWLETDPECGDPEEVRMGPDARIVGVMVALLRQ